MISRAISRASLVLIAGMLAVGCGKRADSEQAGQQASEPAEASSPGSESEAVVTPAQLEPFDINSVPLAATALPPFPYLDWPTALPDAERVSERIKPFDAITVIAARQFLDVEGRLEVRSYSIPKTMSQIEIRRNYANQIKALGGVQVNQLNPVTSSASMARAVRDIAGPDVDVAQRLGLQRYDEGSYEYEVYVLRAPDTTAWIVLQTSQYSAVITTLAQQAMTQTVGLVQAEAIMRELDSTGHVALYINFDTDKASLRPDAAPAVGEIVKLLKSNPSLDIAIEGHTDNSGSSERNKELSLERANAVVAALHAAGIAPTRLTAAGFGQEKPLAENTTDEGRAKNRRVELVKR